MTDWEDDWPTPYIDVPTVEYTDPQPTLYGPDGEPIAWDDRPIGYRPNRDRRR